MQLPLEAFRDDESRSAWPSKDVVRYLFGDKKAANDDVIAFLDELDRHGIVHAFVPVDVDTLGATAETLSVAPDRFSFVLRVNPHDGMRGVRQLEQAVGSYPALRAVHVAPHQLYPSLSPNSREYYPLYAKCIELGLPVMINVGFPGPRVPAASQHPMHLDEVLWFFPELTLVMKHGGEPWVDECVKLLLRWPNAYYMTSGFAPKRYPPAIVEFAKNRGRGKVMYAGYWPRLGLDRLTSELAALPLDDAAADDFLFLTACGLFKLDLPR